MIWRPKFRPERWEDEVVQPVSVEFGVGGPFWDRVIVGRILVARPVYGDKGNTQGIANAGCCVFGVNVEVQAAVGTAVKGDDEWTIF